MARMIFAAKLENLPVMLDCIEDGSLEQGFDAATVNEVRLACEEALVNVIHYAYPGKDGDLEIIYHNKKEGLEIQIIDSGVPFDPLSLPAPDTESPIEERGIGGLGIYLMRKVMNEVKYQREYERNILTLIKYNPDGVSFHFKSDGQPMLEG